MTRISLDDPKYFLNRDISWLAFNRRVLEEAGDEGNPLLERLKFLSISASNLDEFFEVRIAAILQQIEDGYNEAGADGLTLNEKRDILNKQTHEFVDDQYDCWNAKLRPALAEQGIRVLGLQYGKCTDQSACSFRRRHLRGRHSSRRARNPWFLASVDAGTERRPALGHSVLLL